LAVTGGSSIERSFVLERVILGGTVGQTSTAARLVDLSGRVSARFLQVTIAGGRSTVGGNIRILGPDAHLELVGSSIEGGSATLAGGGIRLNGGTLVLRGSSINTNITDGFGGGISCFSSGQVTIESGTVGYNHAVGDGGGIHLDNCTLTIAPPAGTMLYINGNAAAVGTGAGRGGAIFATHGSLVTLHGSGEQNLRFETSFAERGGALFLEADGTAAEIRNSTIQSNSAAVGAGLAVEAGASAVISNVSFQNSATISGGSIYLGTGGIVEVRRSVSGYSSAPSGSFATVEGSGSELRLEGVVLRHGFHSIIEATEGAAVIAGFVTAWRNNLFGKAAFSADATSSFKLYSSLVLDAALFDLATGGTYEADCLVTLSVAGLPPPPRPDSYWLAASLGQVMNNVDGSSDRPRPDGPAIDFCDSTFYTPLDYDLDGDLRGQDSDPAGSTRFGTFDLGVDEAPIIFFADHEEGDCSDWTGTPACP
jgi:hypothetical protein